MSHTINDLFMFSPKFVMTDILDELLPPETEGITKEQDEEIMKAKQRQVD